MSEEDSTSKYSENKNIGGNSGKDVSQAQGTSKISSQTGVNRSKNVSELIKVTLGGGDDGGEMGMTYSGKKLKVPLNESERAEMVKYSLILREINPT
jgi:hypothetical protein